MQKQAKAAAKGEASRQIVSKMPQKKELIQNLNDKTGDFERKDQVIKALENTPNDKQALMSTIKDQQSKVKDLDQAKLLTAVGENAPEFAEKEQLMKALAAQQDATGLLMKASALKDKAMKCLNPVERQRMLQEAYDNEVQANGQSKWAKRMQSGVWQGGVGGAGVGGGVGMGIGAVVGTVSGAVLSLPTTALGGLIGMGVGGATGPFIKLDQKKAKEVAEREKKKGKSEEEIAETVKKEAAVEGNENGDDAPEDGADAGPDTPAAISQPEPGSAMRSLSRHNSSGQVAPPAEDKPKPKKKPRKIEVRSGKRPAPAKGGAGSDKENQAAQEG